MLSVTALVKSYSGDKASSRTKRKNSTAKVVAVNDVNFEVAQGELFTLLGPSGCGKTTTLRSIAGLETPDSGTIEVAGHTLFAGTVGARRPRIDVPANKRSLGMVFQSYAIWPHMTVFDNVAFPLQVMPRRHRPSKQVISERVSRVLTTMQLEQYADRHATKLSGGQQQRLALARALVIEPSLLLLDEPLSNLDAKLRDSLRYELKRLQRDLGITSIYVTHDQVEALALSSKIAVMEAGSIVQLGKPREIYERPATKFVAEFIGTSNFIPGKIAAKVGERYAVDTTHGRLLVPCHLDHRIGTEAIVSLRPESIDVSVSEPADADHIWRGRVVTRAFLGEAVDHVVEVGGREIRARSGPDMTIEPGAPVYVKFASKHLSLVPLT